MSPVGHLAAVHTFCSPSISQEICVTLTCFSRLKLHPPRKPSPTRNLRPVMGPACTRPRSPGPAVCLPAPCVEAPITERVIEILLSPRSDAHRAVSGLRTTPSLLDRASGSSNGTYSHCLNPVHAQRTNSLFWSLGSSSAPGSPSVCELPSPTFGA